MTTADLLCAWGCPPEYREDHPPADDLAPFARERRAVSAAANWYPEMDAALAAMARAGDADAVRQWDREAVEAAGDDGDCYSAGEYIEILMGALEDLADAIEEGDDR